MKFRIVVPGAALLLIAGCNDAPPAETSAPLETAGPVDETDAVSLAEQTIDNAMTAAQEAPPAASDDTIATE